MLEFSRSYTANDGGDEIDDITCVRLGEADLVNDDPNGRYIFPTKGTMQLKLPPPPSLGRLALVYASLLAPYYDLSARTTNFYRSTMLYVWAHTTFSGLNLNYSDVTTYRHTDSDLLFISCRPTLRTASFLVQTDANGQVMSYRQVSPFDPNISTYVEPTMNLSVLYTKLTPILSLWDDDDIGRSNYTYAPDWTKSTLKILKASDSLVNPNAPLSNTTFIPILESLHRRLFNIALSLRPQILVSSSPGTVVTGNILYVQPRVFMNSVSFMISMIILGLNLVVAIAYYLNRPAKFLPCLPTSIASVFAYVAASHARGELRQGKKAETYRFGRFIGVDGKMHTGIEEAARVFPLPSSYHDNRFMGWMRKKERPPPVPPKN